MALGRWIAVLAVACFVLGALPAASANTPSRVNGKATSCSGLGACVYNVSNAGGYGWVRTTTAFGSYASFRLPSETNATTGAPYIATVVNVSGTTNHVLGSFLGIDVNSGKIVSGTTDANVTKTTHCYRNGCSNTYSLINGSVVVRISKLDGTRMVFGCSPSSILAAQSTTCTVTVTDAANASFHPTGNVSMKVLGVGVGQFANKGVCKLTNGACSLKFTGSDEFVGTATFSASYSGNSVDYKSSALTRISVSGS
ncbi:MAG: hypothetical protein L3K04_05150 [Thermoplasmata archaeon]|nr:hypothetical protein [Thermoplasmata archaeon]